MVVAPGEHDVPVGGERLLRFGACRPGEQERPVGEPSGHGRGELLVETESHLAREHGRALLACDGRDRLELVEIDRSSGEVDVGMAHGQGGADRFRPREHDVRPGEQALLRLCEEIAQAVRHPGPGRVVVDRLVDDRSPRAPHGQRDDLGRREADPEDGLGRVADVLAELPGEPAAVHPPYPGRSARRQELGRDDLEGRLPLRPLRALEGAQRVSRPRVADPELLDVGDAPPARGEAAHLLLGLGVVEAEGEVRVEEEVAPHSTGVAAR